MVAMAEVLLLMLRHHLAIMRGQMMVNSHTMATMATVVTHSTLLSPLGSLLHPAWTVLHEGLLHLHLECMAATLQISLTNPKVHRISISLSMDLIIRRIRRRRPVMVKMADTVDVITPTAAAVHQQGTTDIEVCKNSGSNQPK